MDIQNLVIADHHINLIRALKDYHHYIWEISKVVVPVVITSLVTIIVMRGNDRRNKKRWQNEGYLKRKIELEIQIRQILLNLKRQLDKFPDLKSLKEIKDNPENYLEELNEINQTFSDIKIKRAVIKDDFNLESLLDEYLVFVKKRNVFDEYKKIHQDFLTKQADGDPEIAITIYSFKEQTEKIISIIEHNFKISNRH